MRNAEEVCTELAEVILSEGKRFKPNVEKAGKKTLAIAEKWESEIRASQAARIKELEAAIQEIKNALQETGEFGNYECEFGHTLGECPNKECIHCRIQRVLKELNI